MIILYYHYSIIKINPYKTPILRPIVICSQYVLSVQYQKVYFRLYLYNLTIVLLIDRILTII